MFVYGYIYIYTYMMTFLIHLLNSYCLSICCILICFQLQQTLDAARKDLSQDVDIAQLLIVVAKITESAYT